MTEVRRVRVEDWREVRDLRIEAVSDPDAAIAFLSTPAEERARDDAFWQHRAAITALGDDWAQFIADDDGRWVGCATVRLLDAGIRDYLDRPVDEARADVVGVYVSPDHRGTGVLGSLFAAAAEWAAARGHGALTLETHVDNLRAQAAYRKVGFAPTGETTTSSIGPEIVMRRDGSVTA